MARYANATPKAEAGNTTRIFGAFGRIITKAQSTLITSGHDLERMVKMQLEPWMPGDDFFNNENKPGIYYSTAKKLRELCPNLDIPKERLPDLLIVDNREGRRIIYFIELKIGDAFDTKKANAEQESIERFSNELSSQLDYKTHIFVCSFFAKDIQSMYIGWKEKISRTNLITGMELCNKFGMDFDAIEAAFEADKVLNMKDFAADAVADPERREYILQAIYALPAAMRQNLLAKQSEMNCDL